MYFVNNKPFANVEDAISFCEKTPGSVLIDNTGAVLRRHAYVPSVEMYCQLRMAKEVLKKQLSKN